MFQRGKYGARQPLRARIGLEVLEDRLALSATSLASVVPLAGQAQIAIVPTDSRFGDQWALKNASNAAADINAPQAWDVTTGSTKMVVSVMDTGIDYTHPDLYLNVWLNQNEIPLSRRVNLIDIDGDGLITFRDLNDARNQGTGKITDLDGDKRITGADILKPMVKDSTGKDTGKGGWADGKDDTKDGYIDDLIGWNFVNNNNNPMDSHGHGTHIAGTIGAVGNNGLGVAGINWKVQMMAIRFMDGEGQGSINQFILGLQYAVAHGAKVSNNSWVGVGVSDDLTKAIDAARAKGHILVAAAGNQGSDNDASPNYPASYAQDNVLSVAGMDRNGNLAGFSNYGKTTVDLAAPGSDVLSTAIGGGYKYNSGTSMATPHVAGVVALVWSRNPGWTHSQVIAQVLNTADRTPAFTGKIKAGIVNAAAAVGAVVASSTPPRIINAVNMGTTTSLGTTIRVTFDRAINGTTFTTADVVLTGPDGKTVSVSAVKLVAGYANQVFDVVLGTAQTRAGSYTLVVGPNVKDNAGTLMTAFRKVFSVSAPSVPARIINAGNLGNSTTSMGTIRVTFDRTMNPSTFSPADVVLTGPDGKTIAVSAVKSVAGYGDRVFDIVLGTVQTRGGNYTLRVGTAVNDTSGVSMTVFQKVFTLTTPVSSPVIINAGNLGNSATSMGTIRVTFDRAMNPSTFSPADVVLTGPDGKAIAVSAVKSVASYGDRVFDIVLGTVQTRGGNYTLKVGPTVADTTGTLMVGVFQRVFTLTTPVSSPVIINAGNLGNSATSMGTIRVTFDRTMNPSTFSPADVVLTGPDGKTIAVSAVKSVAGYGDRVFDIVLGTVQTRGGNYTLKVGPAVNDTFGVSMAVFQRVFTLASQAAPAPATVTYTSTSVVNVPKQGMGVSLLTVADNFVIGDVNVKLNLTHPRVSDLYIYLQAPDGTSILLSNQKGGNSANFVNTMFDDQATTAVGFGTGPYTGSYKPDAPLASLNGKSVKGTWKLWVTDRAGSATGTVLNWGLVVKPKATM